MRAAIYSRVSTEDQEKEGTSLQTQVAVCLSPIVTKKGTKSFDNSAKPTPALP